VWSRCPARCRGDRAAAAERTAAGLLARAEARAAAERPAAPAPARAASSSRRPARKAAPARRRPAAAERPMVPVVLVHVDAAGRLAADVPDVPDLSDARTLEHLFCWVDAADALGVAKVHPDARAADPLVILSAEAARLLKLPAKLPGTAKAAATLAAKVAKAAEAAGLETGAVGASPIVRVFRRRGAAGRKVSAALVVVPWLAADTRPGRLLATLADTGAGMEGATLARRLRTVVAHLGVLPATTEASTALALLEAVRPREQWDRTRGGWVLKDGALPSGDTAVPVAAGSRHPLTQVQQRAGQRVCEEEDYRQWTRPLTADERLLPWAVTVDVSTSYLSVTERLGLPVGPLELEQSPRWDEKRAGLWHCDFTGVAVEPELPHPSEWTGRPPTGPGWYATPTVAYMVTAYGFDPSTVTAAYLPATTTAYLAQWTARLRDAYKACMAALGVPDGMAPAEFLAADAARPALVAADPAAADAAAVATLVKGVYKAGIGRWAYRGDVIDSDDEWAEQVAARWWYRPEVRHTVIAAARVAAHRRMRRTLELTGLSPFAVNVDALMYASSEPSPLPLLPAPLPDGRPVPGALRLGAAPGSYKHESSIPMAAVLAAVDAELHPVRLIHDYDTTGRAVLAAADPKGE